MCGKVADLGTSRCSDCRSGSTCAERVALLCGLVWADDWETGWNLARLRAKGTAAMDLRIEDRGHRERG